MNLGIYGDSFADTGVNQVAELAELAWPCLLARHFDQVHNHALAGTSLFWSMSQFERTHHLYDRIIFLVTSTGRWPGMLWAQGMSQPRPIPGIRSCSQEADLIAQAAISAVDQRLLQRTIRAVELWYADAQVRPFEDYVQKLMTDRIIVLRPDAIIVPIDRESTGLLDQTGLTDFILRSVQWFKPEIASTSQLLELLVEWRERNQPSCHLTAEAHQVVYEQMVRALDLGQWQPQVPQAIAHAHDWDYYWCRRCA
jgi:hypothetical protein